MEIENINDYKGIYFEDPPNQKFFEFGAHFEYKVLYKKLEVIVKNQNNNDENLNTSARTINSFIVEEIEENVKNLNKTIQIQEDRKNFDLEKRLVTDIRKNSKIKEFYSMCKVKTKIFENNTNNDEIEKEFFIHSNNLGKKKCLETNPSNISNLSQKTIKKIEPKISDKCITKNSNSKKLNIEHLKFHSSNINNQFFNKISKEKGININIYVNNITTTRHPRKITMTKVQQKQIPYKNVFKIYGEEFFKNNLNSLQNSVLKIPYKNIRETESVVNTISKITHQPKLNNLFKKNANSNNFNLKKESQIGNLQSLLSMKVDSSFGGKPIIRVTPNKSRNVFNTILHKNPSNSCFKSSFTEVFFSSKKQIDPKISISSIKPSFNHKITQLSYKLPPSNPSNRTNKNLKDFRKSEISKSLKSIFNISSVRNQKD